MLLTVEYFLNLSPYNTVFFTPTLQRCIMFQVNGIKSRRHRLQKNTTLIIITYIHRNYYVTFLQGVVVFGLLYQQPLQYQQYTYPQWAVVLGWGLACSSILMIPIVAIYKLATTPGTFRQVTLLWTCHTDIDSQLEFTNNTLQT